jgi:hypothetical protein
MGARHALPKLIQCFAANEYGSLQMGQAIRRTGDLAHPYILSELNQLALQMGNFTADEYETVAGLAINMGIHTQLNSKTRL